MSDERCDLCGRLLRAPEGYRGFKLLCQAGISADDQEGTNCDGNAIGVYNDNRGAPGADLIREALRAPLLREALREALDGWEREHVESIRATASAATAEHDQATSADLARIVELRGKFLGRT